MARFGMVIDTRRCVGCMDCVVACKTENEVPDGLNRDWITTEVRGHVPRPSRWRSAASAATTATTRPASPAARPAPATSRSSAGSSWSTHDQCIGCKACLASCPYDARFIHPDGYADKCTFCIHRVEEGQDPACVAVCPTHCMHFGDLDDPHSRGAPPARLARAPRAAARGRHEAAHLLPDLRRDRRDRAHHDARTTRWSTRSSHVWGWEIPVYLFLGGLVAGMMVISGYFLFSGRDKNTRLRLLRAARA